MNTENMEKDKNSNSFYSDCLTPAEAAQFLGCSEYTVRAKAREGILAHYRIGNMIRFRRSTLLRWIEEQEKSNVTKNNT